MTKVLYINHFPSKCGVFQAGDRLGNALLEYGKNDYIYEYVNSEEYFWQYYNNYRPDLVFFNYFPSTIGPWCTPDFCHRLNQQIPLLAICHEQQQLEPILEQFKHVAILDPTFETNDPNILITRNGVPDYRPFISAPNIVPTFGSFGFGFANKGWNRILEVVNNEFDDAYIRLHIPQATFGDSDGAHMRGRVKEAQEFPLKPGISLEISHDYLSESDLIDWLGQNDCNCFFYDDMPNRGVSSTTDYALAARKPIAITNSAMFKHLTVPDIRIESTSLSAILERGIAPLEPLYQYTMGWVVNRYEDFIKEII